MRSIANWFSRGGLWAGLLGASVSAMAQAAAPPDVRHPSWLVVVRPDAVARQAGAQSDPTPRLMESAQAARDRLQRARTGVFQRVLADSGLVPTFTAPAGTAFRVDGPAHTAGPQAVERLRQHPDVLEVVPNERLRRHQAAGTEPNDPLWAQQWHLQAASRHAGAISWPSAWLRSRNTTTAPVVVAVLDSGIRADHPDLAGRVLPGHDFVSEVDYANDGDGRDADASDPGDWVSAAESRTPVFAGCEPENSSWHGTAIAGEIAALTDNGQGVAGVNPGAHILPVRVAGKCGALLSDLLDGLRWAAGLPVEGVPLNPRPARVINLSYGGSGACNSAYQMAIDEVRAAGAMVVVAAGNDASTLTRPADCRGVFAVTAVRADGLKAGYASYGANVALAAPGGSGTGDWADGLISTSNTGTRGPVGPGYETFTGTSFSAPLAAGVASLVWGIQPTWTVTQLEEVLRRTARSHTTIAGWPACSAAVLSQSECQCHTTACGAGLLDADAAVAAALASQPGGTPAVVSAPGTDGAGGGGGAWSGVWGVGLWVWVAGTAWSVRRRRRSAGDGPVQAQG